MGIFVGIALLMTPALTRRAVRRRRRPEPAVAVRGDPGVTAADAEPQVIAAEEATLDTARRRAHHAWDELLDTMVDYRFPVDPADTPRVTIERLVDSAALAGDASAGARVLSTAEEQARYARRPAPGDGLSEALDSVRRAIRGRVSRRTRLVAALLPPSLVYRWRSSAVVGGAAAINRAARTRDRVLALFNLRRLFARGAR